jgi:hypothetical protein
MGFLTVDAESGAKTYLTLPNTIMRRIFIDYFSSIDLRKELGMDAQKNLDAANQMAMDGKADLFAKAMSDVLAETSDRVYLHFAETNMQFLGYTILKDYTGYSTDMELDAGYGHVDLAMLPGGVQVKYYGLVELKYIKSGELQEPEGSTRENIEDLRIALIRKQWDKSLKALKKYSLSKDFSELQHEGRLKKWIIIFSTHRCLVNQDVEIDDPNVKMELQPFERWCFDEPKHLKAESAKNRKQ